MSMISLLPLPEGSDFRHLQASFNKSKPRTTLTVETTIILPICDKFCQNLYKSVPIFMSFASFQVYFHRFHFDLTFFIFTPLSVRRGVGGEVKNIERFWAFVVLTSSGLRPPPPIRGGFLALFLYLLQFLPYIQQLNLDYFLLHHL